MLFFKLHYRYEVFHQDQTGIVKLYPDMVKQELEGYDMAVCKFFMVGRSPDVSFYIACIAESTFRDHCPPSLSPV